MALLQATYILPLKARDTADLAGLAEYVNALPVAQILLVDGSANELFEHLGRMLAARVRHLRPDPRIGGANGKVRNVLTGLQHAAYEQVIVADDDVRYDGATLARLLEMLERADVVRPQNYFSPLPWHALLDTGRTLINRALDGDWPGTLVFRRSMLPRGYNADVLFENYELVRTIKARGGREVVARDVFVLRSPPAIAHFWSQRVRQAYDEFARPARMAASLAILPAVVASAAMGRWRIPAAIGAASVALAAYGWARDGGSAHLPALGIAAAPLWTLERAVCAWLAVCERVRFGGVRYAGTIVRDAASPREELQRWAA